LKKVIFYIIILLNLNVQSQDIDSASIDPTTFDYAKVDSIALNFSSANYKSIEDLSHALTVGLKTEHEKFRVLFRWVTDNIEYNLGSTDTEPKNIVKKRKAVCAGYSSLLKSLCDYSGIEIQIINGTAKSYPEDIGITLKKGNHSWNAVNLYGKWYLVDATWAAGYYDLKKRIFYKHYDETWFLSDPAYFALLHHPKENKWQLINPLYKKRIFRETPIFYPLFRKYNIKLVDHINGKIRNDLKIKFTSDTEIKDATIFFEDTDTTYNPSLIRLDNGKYEIKYKFTKSVKGSFYLLLNGKVVFGFWKK
jgi:transglutaminase/protease-like cytokinesis protein 3